MRSVVCKPQKLGIECDGDQWHPEGNKRDRFRDYILRRGGWKILWFREDKILNDVSKCVDEIELEMGDVM